MLVGWQFTAGELLLCTPTDDRALYACMDGELVVNGL